MDRIRNIVASARRVAVAVSEAREGGSEEVLGISRRNLLPLSERISRAQVEIARRALNANLRYNELAMIAKGRTDE